MNRLLIKLFEFVLSNPRSNSKKHLCNAFSHFVAKTYYSTKQCSSHKFQEKPGVTPSKCYLGVQRTDAFPL